MKKTILSTLLFTALLTGCSTTEVKPVFTRNQPADKAADTLNNHAVKVNIAESYCTESKVVHYYEGNTYYSFRCEDGRYFNLNK